MASNNKNKIISDVHPHSIKKFELIEAYVEAWAHKLLEYGRNTGNLNGLVFIDCMCNSGVYMDDQNNTIYGTPIRVAKILSSIMREKNYYNQQAYLYFNDWDSRKIDELKKHLPDDTHNFHIYTYSIDGNDLLRKIGKQLNSKLKMSYLLVYDPYTAAIDWTALFPFLRHWGEVIINHMVSDSIRAISQAKTPKAISKYEGTYLTEIEDLLSFGSNRTAYEEKIKNVILLLRGQKRYYIASFPFFNSNNALVYDLLHCTNSIEGFKLYKSTAWKTFNNQSSAKRTLVSSDQLSFTFEESSVFGDITTNTNDNCYSVKDIAKYLYEIFKGRSDVSLSILWSTLDEHPVFPSDLFKNDIKNELRLLGCKVHKSSVDFV